MSPTIICPIRPALIILSEIHSAIARKKKNEMRVRMLMTVSTDQRVFRRNARCAYDVLLGSWYSRNGPLSSTAISNGATMQRCWPEIVRVSAKSASWDWEEM